MLLFALKSSEKGIFWYCPHLTPTFGGKKYSSLVIEDGTNYAWSNFLKEKLGLNNAIRG